MDYEKEYGRYKKKVEDQQKEIEKLREEVQGWKMLMDANNALICTFLVAVGADDKDHCLKVSQELIKKALEGGYRVVSDFDPEARVHSVFYEVPEGTENR